MYSEPSRSVTSDAAAAVADRPASTQWRLPRVHSPRTLRLRLMLWNSALVLGVVAISLLSLRAAMGWAVLHESDQLLSEDAVEIQLAVQELHPDFQAIRDEMDRHATSHAHRSLFVQVYKEDGSLFWSSAGFGPTPTGPPVPATVGLPRSDGPHRVLDRWIRPRVGQLSLLRVGSSLDYARKDVDRLTGWMLVVLAAVALIAPVGGFWLAGRMTQPLARIIDSTNELHPTNLAERLSDRGTGDELDRLAFTINGFLDRIAGYVRRNREFASLAAHELRSPLAAIQSSAEVALTRDRPAEEYRDLLVDIIEQCEHLSSLIGQLLFLAETENAVIEDEGVVDLHEVIDRSFVIFHDVAEHLGISLRIVRLDHCEVRGNAHHLRQVVNNLIDNALKYTERGGRVELALLRDIASNQVVLTVRDTGKGISSEDFDHVFDRFYRSKEHRVRAHSSEASPATGQGIGLGLSICRAILQAHGGTIEVESTLGEGSTFTARLPAVNP